MMRPLRCARLLCALVAGHPRHGRVQEARTARRPRRVRRWSACGPTGCPRDRLPRRSEGGELRVHVEAEPAILCDLVEHDVWSRWIMENQVAETLFFQDPWTGAVSGRLAERFEATRGSSPSICAPT